MKRNILIFPAGSEIAFEIHNALKYSKFVTLFGGTSVLDHSEFVFERLIAGFPKVDEDGFLSFLNRTIDDYNIDCVYPAHDSVSVFLSEHREEIHAQAIIADAETTAICRSKSQTYAFFEGEPFIPRTYAFDCKDIPYPVFVKPTVGQGSNGAKIIQSYENLLDAFREDSSLVICEYLPGMEYTVDCFTDGKGNLLAAKLRDRSRIRNGISVRSKSYADDPKVWEIAETINSRMHFRGAWFFQLKRNTSGEYRLLEISPRIPGTMGLSRNMGINFPLLTLFVFWGYDVSIIDNAYDIELDRAFYSAYRIQLEYEHVYLDFDDTMIIDGKVNQDIMRFVYQAINQGKKLHLLSKHATDIYQDLRKYRIAENLFDSIDVLAINDEKHRYINEEKAIFIDDSFAERKKVHEMLGIAVFDVDMVESLVDWKE